LIEPGEIEQYNVNFKIPDDLKVVSIYAHIKSTTDWAKKDDLAWSRTKIVNMQIPIEANKNIQQKPFLI